MDLIDRTIDFLDKHRGMKIFFFETIKKNIYESSNTLIEYKTIQQLLFLDDKCYQMEWKMNEKIRRYDLKLMASEISSMDGRRAQMRANIVRYLSLKET